MFSLRKESGLASSHLYSEEVLENLLSYYPHGVVAIFDLELRITTIGGKILEELAYSPSRIEGRAVHELFDADGRSLIVPAFEEALEDRESSFVMRYAGRSFEVTVTPIRRNGEVQGGLG